MGALSFLSLLVIACFLTRTTPDGDLWGHLTFGRDIVRSGSLPSIDPYSFTSDRAWINHEWLAEVIMWSAYAVGGVAGLVAFKLMLACATGVALLETWGPRADGRGARDAMLLLTAVGTWPLLATMRPQAFSMFLFGLLLFALDRIHRGATRWLYGLPLVFAVWVNVHGGWVVGAGTLVIFVACSWWDAAFTKRRRLLVFGSACAAALATLCNPYGLSMLQFLTETVRPTRADIVEWQPATQVPLVVVLLWLVPTAIAATGLWRHRHGSDSPIWTHLVVLCFAVASFRVIRLVGFYALAVGFLYAPWMHRAAQDPRARRSSREGRALRVAAVCATLIVLSVGAFGRVLTMDAEWMPEREAAMFVKTNGISGRMLTWFDYGEFAIWHFSPAVRVSMDGRRETIYSDELRERHWRIYMNAPGALEEVARLAPDYIWLPADFGVVNRLEEVGWRRVFTGPRSVVLSKQAIPAVVAAVQPPPALRAFPGP